MASNACAPSEIKSFIDSNIMKCVKGETASMDMVDSFKSACEILSKLEGKTNDHTILAANCAEFGKVLMQLARYEEELDAWYKKPKSVSEESDEFAHIRTHSKYPARHRGTKPVDDRFDIGETHNDEPGYLVVSDDYESDQDPDYQPELYIETSEGEDSMMEELMEEAEKELKTRTNVDVKETSKYNLREKRPTEQVRESPQKHDASLPSYFDLSEEYASEEDSDYDPNCCDCETVSDEDQEDNGAEENSKYPGYFKLNGDYVSEEDPDYEPSTEDDESEDEKEFDLESYIQHYYDVNNETGNKGTYPAYLQLDEYISDEDEDYQPPELSQDEDEEEDSGEGDSVDEDHDESMEDATAKKEAGIESPAKEALEDMKSPGKEIKIEEESSVDQQMKEGEELSFGPATMDAQEHNDTVESGEEEEDVNDAIYSSSSDSEDADASRWESYSEFVESDEEEELQVAELAWEMLEWARRFLNSDVIEPEHIIPEDNRHFLCGTIHDAQWACDRMRETFSSIFEEGAMLACEGIEYGAQLHDISKRKGGVLWKAMEPTVNAAAEEGSDESFEGSEESEEILFATESEGSFAETSMTKEEEEALMDVEDEEEIDTQEIRRLVKDAIDFCGGEEVMAKTRASGATGTPYPRSSADFVFPTTPIQEDDKENVDVNIKATNDGVTNSYADMVKRPLEEAQTAKPRREMYA